jgi:hypothetical protein
MLKIEIQEPPRRFRSDGSRAPFHNPDRGRLRRHPGVGPIFGSTAIDLFILMRLTAGTKLGPYEIPSPCVKGEVYRAIRNLTPDAGESF